MSLVVLANSGSCNRYKFDFSLMIITINFRLIILTEEDKLFGLKVGLPSFYISVVDDVAAGI